AALRGAAAVHQGDAAGRAEAHLELGPAFGDLVGQRGDELVGAEHAPVEVDGLDGGVGVLLREGARQRGHAAGPGHGRVERGGAEGAAGALRGDEDRQRRRALGEGPGAAEGVGRVGLGGAAVQQDHAAELGGGGHA
ncbi:MAG: hypothetical protein ACK559_01730, partial [bacterium]